MKRILSSSLLAGVMAWCALAAPTTAAAGTPPTPCAAISAAEPQVGHYMPAAAPVLFAKDFPALFDCEWGYQIGGWGGIQRRSQIRHVPVIFVHGNQADAENWYLVRDQFIALAGYTDQEMYAISYNGLANAYAGMPTRSAPAPESMTYWQNNPTTFANGGKGAANDVNVPDLYAFVKAVEDYTGSKQVDIVAHSLGVTITRKMLYDHPEMYREVRAAVMIAGANHGTSVCTGIGAYYYGCDEIAPGSAWLQQLNSKGEAPGPTCWETVYNGLEGDPFFIGPDEQSPHLDGATNLQFAGFYHNDLRVDSSIVPQYLDFIQQHGQKGSAACGVNRDLPLAGQLDTYRF